MTDATADAILTLVAGRGEAKSVCPSEVARALAGDGEDWHKLMPAVRRQAVDLAEAGRIAILRKGKPVDPANFKGVYRLGLPRTGQGPGNSADVLPDQE